MLKSLPREPVSPLDSEHEHDKISEYILQSFYYSTECIIEADITSNCLCIGSAGHYVRIKCTDAWEIIVIVFIYMYIKDNKILTD